VAIQPTRGGLRVADLVPVAQGAIPSTTGGKVRRSGRLDAPA
jgi:hypothetical protein